MKLKGILFFSFVLFSAIIAFGQIVEVRKQHFNIDKKGLAIQGYDPVAYITENKAREGKTDLSYTWNGVSYLFYNDANKQLFISDPGKYEPAYGGWCAYAMGAKNEKIKIDPETFKVVQGKTYLFYNFYFNNTLTDWNKNETGLKSKADISWNKITQTR